VTTHLLFYPVFSHFQAFDEGAEIALPTDLPQALRLLDEMNNNVKQVSDLVGNMLERVKNGELSTEYGLSFLEIKYHMLLNYLINLTYVVLRKCSGQTIKNDPSIDRLIEIRTILEKIRPIDHKLRYQIDKLVKTAVTGASGVDSTDPASFKANPDNMISQLGMAGSDSDEDDDDSDEEVAAKTATGRKKGDDKGDASGSGLYVPPKLTAVHYEEDSKADKARKQLERARKRALNSSLIQDLKEEYLETPLEINDGSKAQHMYTKAQKEKEKYEEAYLTRLPMTKEEKQRQRRMTTLGEFG
jgi:U3 small nucleolar ribonucleoprotein protein LCP5